MVAEIDRARLEFPEAVVNAFKFLENEYSFQCVIQKPTFVRYESSLVYVNVFHGRSSFEIGVELGRLPKVKNGPEESFSLGELIEFLGVEKEKQRSYFQTKEYEAIRRLVPKLAALLKMYGQQALKGDLKIFEELKRFQGELSDKFLLEVKINRIREKASEAWHKKEYQEFIRLCEPVKDYLDSIEIKKLEYAKRKTE